MREREREGERGRERERSTSTENAVCVYKRVLLGNRIGKSSNRI